MHCIIKIKEVKHFLQLTVYQRRCCSMYNNEKNISFFDGK